MLCMCSSVLIRNCLARMESVLCRCPPIRLRTVYGLILDIVLFFFFCKRQYSAFTTPPPPKNHTQYFHNLLAQPEYTIHKQNRLRKWRTFAPRSDTNKIFPQPKITTKCLRSLFSWFVNSFTQRQRRKEDKRKDYRRFFEYLIRDLGLTF